MKINILLPGPSIETARLNSCDLTIAVNSASLYHPHDLLCFIDPIVKEKLIDTGKVNPTLGFITTMEPWCSKVHIHPTINLDKIATTPLTRMVLQRSYFTSQYALGVGLFLGAEKITLYGLDFTLDPTATMGEWHSQHTLWGFFKEVIWLKVLMESAKGCIVGIGGGKWNFFHSYLVGDMGDMEFLTRFRESVL